MNIEPERAGEFEKIPNGSHIWLTDGSENLDAEKLGVKENVLIVRKVYEFA